MAAPELLLLPVELLRPNPNQPRTVFDGEEIAELARSLAKDGVLSPVLVRNLDDGYEIIAGERRWRACQVAGISQVPALLRDDLSEADVARIALVENTQRVNLNAMEEATAVAKIKESLDLSDEAVAQLLSKSRSYVSGLLGLLRLPEAVQRKVAAGVLTPGHGKVLARVSDPAQCEELASRVVAEGLSVRDLEEAVLLGDEPRKRTRRQLGGRILSEVELAAAEQLSNKLDTLVRVKGSKARGKIVIEYAGQDDLIRVLAALGVQL